MPQAGMRCLLIFDGVLFSHCIRVLQIFILLMWKYLFILRMTYLAGDYSSSESILKATAEDNPSPVATSCQIYLLDSGYVH